MRLLIPRLGLSVHKLRHEPLSRPAQSPSASSYELHLPAPASFSFDLTDAQSHAARFSLNSALAVKRTRSPPTGQGPTNRCETYDAHDFCIGTSVKAPGAVFVAGGKRAVRQLPLDWKHLNCAVFLIGRL